jgi:hypothetical protein
LEDSTDRLEAWCRTRLTAMNRQLEDRYREVEDRTDPGAVAIDERERIPREGLILTREAITRAASDPDENLAFRVLGFAGFLLASCARHDVLPTRPTPGSDWDRIAAAAHRIGIRLGVVPRFTTAHLQLFNRFEDDTPFTFSGLDAERLFTVLNVQGQYAYRRAAECLHRVQMLGPEHPVAGQELRTAASSLEQALEANLRLFRELDPEIFFFCIRPYFKSHPVGTVTYRGANAGDFSAVNEIDLRVGLVVPEDRSYFQLLFEKLPYLPPGDPDRLRDALTRRPVLDELIEITGRPHCSEAVRENAGIFLRIVELHGSIARAHHDQLVTHFIEAPARALREHARAAVTASGPPLDALLTALARLRDLRSPTEAVAGNTRYDVLHTLATRLA